MIRGIKYLLTIFACLAVASISSLACVDIVKTELTLEQYQKLEDGEVLIFQEERRLDNGKIGTWMRAMILVDAPPRVCWEVLNDLAHYYEFQPRLLESTIIERQNSSIVVRLSFKAAWKEVFYHLKYVRDDRRMVLHYRLDRELPRNISDARGWWQAIPYKEGSTTIISYASCVDTGMWVPRLIQRIFTKMDLPNVVSYLKRRIESGGRWNKWKKRKQEAGAN
jgi:ribosome-associated toxin RatA of RatAB toxin-antitoxin module